MSSLTSYTSYTTVRALLGVSHLEITDTTLALDLYVQAMELELGDMAEDDALVTEYERILAVAIGDRTTPEAKLLQLVQLYAGYSVARQLFSSLPMFAPKVIEDGKARMERVANPFEPLGTALQTMCRTLCSRIISLLPTLVSGVVTPNAVSRTYTAAVGLATDPVTNT